MITDTHRSLLKEEWFASSRLRRQVFQLNRLESDVIRLIGNRKERWELMKNNSLKGIKYVTYINLTQNRDPGTYRLLHDMVFPEILKQLKKNPEAILEELDTDVLDKTKEAYVPTI